MAGMTEDEIFLAYYNQEFAEFFGAFDGEKEMHVRIKESIINSLGYSQFRLNIRFGEFMNNILPGVSPRLRWWVFYLLFIGLMTILINFVEALINIFIKW